MLTRAMVGKGRIDEDTDPRELTDLAEPVAQATSNIPEQIGETVSFIVEYRNDLNGGLAEGFWLNEFGVFALDQEDQEILLYYANLGDYPQYVTAYAQGTGAVDVRRYPVAINVSSDAEVVLGYPAGSFMTAEEIDYYIDKKVLPYFFEKAEEIVGDRATKKELAAHTSNSEIHVSGEDRGNWNGKANQENLTDHIDNTSLHVSDADRQNWDAAYTASQDGNAGEAITGLHEKLGEPKDSLPEDREPPVSVFGGINAFTQYVRETLKAELQEELTRTLTSSLETKITTVLATVRRAEFDVPGEYEFTVLEGVYILYVTACGGGGGGLTSSSTLGTGGGGGAAIYRKAYEVTPGEVIKITVGEGGKGGVNHTGGTTTESTSGGATIITGSVNITLSGGASGGQGGGTGGNRYSPGGPGILGIGGLAVNEQGGGGGGSLGHGASAVGNKPNRGGGGGGSSGRSSDGGDGYVEFTW